MKFIQSFILISLLGTTSMFAQSDGLAVYNILQEHCITCHSNGSPQSGLDLEGSGSTASQKWIEVRQNLVGVVPANALAAEKNFDYIYAGRPDLSFLFRKINGGLEPTIALEPGELSSMPYNNPGGIPDAQKEIIRQWILFGAEADSDRFDESVVEQFYNVGGVESFPNGAPAAPDPSEGFQIKMGPYFLSPAGTANDELEYFQKYELDLEEDREVIRLDSKFSGYSHHFIVYDYDTPSAADVVAPGFRLSPYHNNVNLVLAVQQSADIRLPEGSAFSWDNDIVLDLNSHYINYSFTEPLKAEVYLNVYTQESGIAAQEMHTSLLANPGILIPNNEQVISINQTISNSPIDEIFLWGIMGHTHKYGVGYKAWTLENNTQGELIYDGACPEGVPNCANPEFDYQHIPIRYFDEFQQLEMGEGQGLIHQASWLNDGPNSVFFGPTSDDEMMVLVLMFLTDTEGVLTGTGEVRQELAQVQVYPNPMNDYAEFIIPVAVNSIDQFDLYDSMGKRVIQDQVQGHNYRMDSAVLASGMYYYQFTGKGRLVSSGKIVVE